MSGRCELKAQAEWTLVDHVAFLGDDDWILMFYLWPCIRDAAPMQEPYLLQRLLVGTMVEMLVTGLVEPGDYVDGKGFVGWNMELGAALVRLQQDILELDPVGDPHGFGYSPAFNLTDLGRARVAGLQPDPW